jgi:hypothetical protein
MRALMQTTIGVRTQAVSILALAAGWHWIMWFGRKAGENTAVIIQALFYLLPLLTTLLSLSLIGTRLSAHQPRGLWVYLAALVGLSPWLALACWFISWSKQST